MITGQDRERYAQAMRLLKEREQAVGDAITALEQLAKAPVIPMTRTNRTAAGTAALATALLESQAMQEDLTAA